MSSQGMVGPSFSTSSLFSSGHLGRSFTFSHAHLHEGLVQLTTGLRRSGVPHLPPLETVKQPFLVSFLPFLLPSFLLSFLSFVFNRVPCLKFTM